MTHFSHIKEAPVTVTPVKNSVYKHYHETAVSELNAQKVIKRAETQNPKKKDNKLGNNIGTTAKRPHLFGCATLSS